MIFGDVDMFDALLGEVLDRALVALSHKVATEQQERSATHGTTFYGPTVSICVFSSTRCETNMPPPRPAQDQAPPDKALSRMPYALRQMSYR